MTAPDGTPAADGTTAPASTLPVLERPWPGLDVAGLRILVTGFGVSGYAIADQTMQRGARVLVVDGKDTEELRERANILEVLGVEVRLGAEHTRALPADREIDLIVTSPGWRPDQPLLAEAAAAGIPVWSEIEPVSGRRRARRLVQRPVAPTGARAAGQDLRCAKGGLPAHAGGAPSAYPGTPARGQPEEA